MTTRIKDKTMYDDVVYSPEYPTDLDLSFTSIASTSTADRTFSAASSARSSLSLSFNDRAAGFSSRAVSFNDRAAGFTSRAVSFNGRALSFNDRTLSFNDRSLSFNDRLSSASVPSTAVHIPAHHRPHRRLDPHWSSINSAANASHDGRLHLRHLKLLRQLGAGDLGRVFLCRIRDFHHSNPHAHFALKVVDRNSLSSKKLSHIETEARILSTLDHPFLPTLYANITASHYTCLLIDYCSGGDLNTLLRRQPSSRLPLHAVRFYAAEVLVALEYLHSKGIIYRDLKPENILLREDGHIMLSDFDLCFTSDVTPTIDHYSRTRKRRSTRVKKCGCLGPTGEYRYEMGSSEEEEVEEFVAEPTTAYSRSCVGTHEYLAPELATGNGHGNGVDWWAFGVLIYELLHGTTPFKGVDKHATLRNIVSDRDVEFPVIGGGEEVRDLVEGLLVKDPRGRLGSMKGAAEIKRHPFFEGVKWPLIRGYRPPEMGRDGGVLARKGSKSHVMGHVIKRKWWVRSLRYFLKKSKGSLKSLKRNSSGNSYTSIGKSPRGNIAE